MEKKTPSQPLQGKLIPAVFGDMFVQGIPKSNPLLDRESAGHIADYSLGYLQELVARVHEVCIDEEQTEEQKREACETLFSICRDAASMLFKLAFAFPELFKSIASERANFPCLFPALPEEQAFLKWFLFERLQLGSKHELKLRVPRGRKTFSIRGINGLLLLYIEKIRSIQSHLRFLQLSNPGLLLEDRQPSLLERLDDEFPLTPANASRWVDVIWDLLLQDIQHPENDPRLRNLGNRPSRADRAGTIWSPSVTKRKRSRKEGPSRFGSNRAGYARAAIKEGLRKYLVRMLRRQSADK
jgi:hypothetical protein